MQNIKDFTGLRVGYLDYLDIPQTGTVVFSKPHNREPEVYWLAIMNDNSQLNDKPINVNGITIMISDYRRSDRCFPLNEDEDFKRFDTSDPLGIK